MRARSVPLVATLVLALTSVALRSPPAAARGKVDPLIRTRCEAVLRNAHSWSGAPALAEAAVKACLEWYTAGASEAEQQAMTCLANSWGRAAWDGCLVTFVPVEQPPGFRLEPVEAPTLEAAPPVAEEPATGGIGGLIGVVPADVPRVEGEFYGGEAIAQGALDPEVCQAEVLRHLEEIRACYQQGLASQPGLSGKLEVKFVIDKDGAVSSAMTKASTLEAPEVEACINLAFMRFTFPPPSGGDLVVVAYPFVFTTE